MSRLSLLVLWLAFVCIVLINFSYGAQKLDNQKDGCEPIRRAIANPSIHEFRIRRGTYVCNQPIIVSRSRIKLLGEDKRTVTIKLADHANAPLLILGNIQTPPNPVTEISISGITLDGNRENQDYECWGGPCDGGGLSVIRNNVITIRGVRGLTVEGASYSDDPSASYEFFTAGAVLHDITAKGGRSGGLVTEKGCTNLSVSDLESTDNYFDGFAGYQTAWSVFKNLFLHKNLRGAGISVDIHFNNNAFEHARPEDFEVKT